MIHSSTRFFFLEHEKKEKRVLETSICGPKKSIRNGKKSIRIIFLKKFAGCIGRETRYIPRCNEKLNKIQEKAKTKLEVNLILRKHPHLEAIMGRHRASV